MNGYLLNEPDGEAFAKLQAQAQKNPGATVASSIAPPQTCIWDDDIIATRPANGNKVGVTVRTAESIVNKSLRGPLCWPYGLGEFPPDVVRFKGQSLIGEVRDVVTYGISTKSWVARAVNAGSSVAVHLDLDPSKGHLPRRLRRIVWDGTGRGAVTEVLVPRCLACPGGGYIPEQVFAYTFAIQDGMSLDSTLDAAKEIEIRSPKINATWIRITAVEPRAPAIEFSPPIDRISTQGGTVKSKAYRTSAVRLDSLRALARTRPSPTAAQPAPRVSTEERAKALQTRLPASVEPRDAAGGRLYLGVACGIAGIGLLAWFILRRWRAKSLVILSLVFALAGCSKRREQGLPRLAVEFKEKSILIANSTEGLSDGNELILRNDGLG